MCLNIYKFIYTSRPLQIYHFKHPGEEFVENHIKSGHLFKIISKADVF